MALYVAVCIMAELTAVTDAAQAHGRVLVLIWGTAAGLALVHWFAFQLGARLIAQGQLRAADAAVAGAQLAGAALVAALVTLPIIVLPASYERDVARLELAGFIAAVGYVVAHASGASRRRALGFAFVTLALSLVIAGIKLIVTGH